jgi:glyceraldehyde 3-phosphate dehydrogenase
MKKIKIGINGFGRIGRLALRASWHWPEFEFVHINDPAGDAATFAHLLKFDSVQSQWAPDTSAVENVIYIDGKSIAFSRNKTIAETDWSGCDLVIEASGKMREVKLLQAYLDQGVKRVVVSAPVKEPGVLNVVMGVNQHLFDPAAHRIVTAASCTTNCLAPVVKVIHENLGIKHGAITKDLRRARASHSNLIPTSTGSATAIAEIFPELRGKLNGHAVRVPLATGSLTDCVFEVERTTTVDEVNTLLKSASETYLKDILGYETRPLVSSDFCGNPLSSIVDALSTMVVNGSLVKIYAWYDNEWGYANRTVELAKLVGLEN